MLEKSFALELPEAQAEGYILYREPWIGMVHVPFEMPCSWDFAKHPGRMFRTAGMRESLAHCRGLITLSHHLAEGLRAELPSVPVLTLRHPAEPATMTFDFEAYLALGQPIVQIGWWLHRLTSIHWLKVDKRRKHLVVAQVGVNVRR
ncbi:MAG: hypothetical protein ACUVXB_04720 [Bryobacteraceae bacterium]